MKSTDLTFTGERLHEDDALFGIDLMRHQAAYQEAIRLLLDRGAERVLELGSGTGYGTSELAAALPRVVAVDRVAPGARGRASRARFLRADLEAMPLGAKTFDAIVSFQVIEHLEDPRLYLEAMARHLRPGGIALLTTPNRLFSDGENPFHVHEYEANELQKLLEGHFATVSLRGVAARGEALRYHEERLRRIKRIVRIDPLGLRHQIPRSLVEWLFARLAVLVRRGIAGQAGLPEVALTDFPIEPIHEKALDLLAICETPRLSPSKPRL